METENTEQSLNNDSVETNSLDTADTQTQETDTGAALDKAIDDIVELDKLSKFKFGGNEYTPQALKSAILRQSDYTKKTQALADERKFLSNYEYDLAELQRNPNLLDKFKQIYPKSFHSLADYAVKMTTSGQTNSVQRSQEQNQTNPELAEFRSFIEEYRQSKVDSYEKEIQQIASEMNTKYPYADEYGVTARAQSIYEQFRNSDQADKYFDDRGALKKEVWDALYKSSHEKMNEMITKQANQKITKQKDLNSKASEMAPGGQSPGQKPRNLRTFQEAREAFLNDSG